MLKAHPDFLDLTSLAQYSSYRTPMFGWTGKILRVNLTHRTIDEERLDSQERELYLGGRGLGVKWVYDRGQVEPLSPDNLLVFATGPLTGTGALASGRATAVSKSPLTGAICYSNVGGTFGVHVKKTGYDAIIIDGASPEPLLLEIGGDRPVLKNAWELWGKNTGQVFDHLKGYKAVLCIGIAGEKKNRLASIMHNRSHAFGRGGLGAVMGAKGLKAIAINGTGSVKIARPKEFKNRQENLNKIIAASPVLKNLSLLGTPSLIKVINWAGLLPVANFRKSSFPEADVLAAEALKKLYKPKSRACLACPVACKKEMQAHIPLPEYETIGMFGPNNENSALPSIIEVNQICNDYGLDTISVGSTLACYAEIRGVKLKPAEICDLVKDIGEVRGSGAAMGEGSLHYARAQNRKEASMTVKGLELPAYDPRKAYGLALAYGTSNRGGCHLGAYMVAPEALRKPKAIEPRTFTGKPSYLAIFQDTFAAVDSLVVCKFAYLGAGQEEYANILTAVTGETFAADDLNKIGERIWNLERLYNIREGFTKNDDFLPNRFYEKTGLENASVENIDRIHYDKALTEYYRHRGWTDEGVPGDHKLKDLGLMNL
ncbi:MAG: aldehyde ferredoxin oxidoreductase family protein [Thermodesulfobacteriota bacterium]|nr:aldehyde ferredoxin oxidoreductase family protein [Thermodesulfobacteriota bacterium]